MTGTDEMPGEEATATAELEDNPTPGAHWLEQRKYPRGARARMEAEPAVVDEGKVPSVVGLGGRLHPDMIAHALRRRTPGVCAPPPARRQGQPASESVVLGHPSASLLTRERAVTRRAASRADSVMRTARRWHRVRVHVRRRTDADLDGCEALATVVRAVAGYPHSPFPPLNQLR